MWAYGAFVQDDWHVTNALTMNLGLRYDLMWDMFQNQNELLPFMEAGRPQNVNNYQPRVGFAYQWDDRTVIRGGIGKYYGEMLSRTYPGESKTVALVEVANDGRPDFTANPFNGPAPTFEQAKATACSAPEQAPAMAAVEGEQLCWRARRACCWRAASSILPQAPTT